MGSIRKAPGTLLLLRKHVFTKNIPLIAVLQQNTVMGGRQDEIHWEVAV